MNDEYFKYIHPQIKAVLVSLEDFQQAFLSLQNGTPSPWGFLVFCSKETNYCSPKVFPSICCFHGSFQSSNKINVVQLDPANSNSFVLNSLLFQTQNYFPWIWSFSYELISISKSQFLELFFFIYLRVWNSGSVNWMKITEVVIFWVKKTKNF